MDSRNNYNGNPYLQLVAVPPNGYWSPSHSRRPMSRICDVLNRYGKKVDDVTRKAEVFADNVWHHLRVSPSFTDAAVARIAQGTKVLAEGGQDKVFQLTFGILAGEKLLKAYVCYFSTSSGPVVGTLYISTKRLAFCSDHSFCYYSSTGQQQWMYYKVVVELEKVRTVNPSSSRMNPYDKYIQVVTTDEHEFWFMGFISYDKALKQLSDALQRRHGSLGDISVTVV